MGDMAHQEDQSKGIMANMLVGGDSCGSRGSHDSRQYSRLAVVLLGCVCWPNTGLVLPHAEDFLFHVPTERKGSGK